MSGKISAGLGYSRSMPGERAHAIGQEGLDKAKTWLDMTTRVRESWTVHTPLLGTLLDFQWPHGDQRTFSFDMGGRFRGDSLAERSFIAEVKHYKNQSTLPTHYREFLAKCYVALDQHRERCDNFLWISWAPFHADKWDKHTSVDVIQAAVLHGDFIERALGTTDTEEAKDAFDRARALEVSNRIWLMTMNDRQMGLVLTKQHYREVIASIAETEVGA